MAVDFCTTNGCGPQTRDFIPDFGFSELCDSHDEDYNAGGSEFDRLIADTKFIARLRIAVRTWAPSLIRSVTLYFTELIYSAIRDVGKGSFNFHSEGTSQLYDHVVSKYNVFTQREDYLKGVKVV